jgi:hypothetical protein
MIMLQQRYSRLCFARGWLIPLDRSKDEYDRARRVIFAAVFIGLQNLLSGFVAAAKIYARVSQTMCNSLANSSDQVAGQLVVNQSGLEKALKEKKHDNAIL